MTTKTLYLVRHAKSSWKDPSWTDEQRPLNKRGLRDAPEMANRLNDNNIEVDLIITSPANRAKTTAQYIAQGISYKSSKIKQDKKLYFGDRTSMLDIITSTKSSVQSLMLVGHNPDMTSLLNKLCGYQTDNMPTGAIATIQFNNDWSSVKKRSGTVVDYDYPKKDLD